MIDTTRDIHAEIADWRDELDLLSVAHPQTRAGHYCLAYNWSTSPTALRTDEEHRACRLFARHVLEQLRTPTLRHYWRESENGKLYSL